ncbi:hypothetical protein A9995_11510 [Erythrobacter sp. QSSC1-22B]|nr:hypothetical protein A9995_11510 [Erythrobacter sp. QSSC1-22B]
MTLMASPAYAATEISSIIVFGDSLVDAGNIFASTGGTVPSPSLGYFEGRFTNGYNYPDLLSLDLFGRPTVASLDGGTNFAFGGARATTTSGVPDLAEQFGLFSRSGQPIDSTGLYILNFGGNDIFATLGAGAPTGYASDEAFLREAAALYAGGVQFLADRGANNIFITGFPVAGPGLTSSLQAEGFLTTELDRINLSPDVNLLRFDYLDFFQRVNTDPTVFGLPVDLNFTTACQAASALPDCTGYFYFDNTHPTAAIQQAAYSDMNRQFQFAAIAAVPEPGTWAMMLLGFGFIGSAMRSAKRRQKVTVFYA